MSLGIATVVIGLIDVPIADARRDPVSLLIATVVIVLVPMVFLFFARRVLRLALKLAIVGALALLLVAGAAVGWWQGWFSSASRTGHLGPPIKSASESNRRPSR